MAAIAHLTMKLTIEPNGIWISTMRTGEVSCGEGTLIFEPNGSGREQGGESSKRARPYRWHASRSIKFSVAG